MASSTIQLQTQRKASPKTRTTEQAALAEGRFWECSEATLNDYFHVPFYPRRLIDLSTKHRAVLFVELEYGPTINGKDEMSPTARGYLCGIDDNGEQWGFEVTADEANWHVWDYHDTVEDAMATVWQVTQREVAIARRQGELLVWPKETPPTATLRDTGGAEALTPSHTVRSPSLRVYGMYLASDDLITVEHPTHAPLTLEPGSYCWALHYHDAD